MLSQLTLTTKLCPFYKLAVAHDDGRLITKCRNLVRTIQVSAASPGDRPPGNPRGTHGLGRGFVAKMFPGDISALSRFSTNLPGDLPTGFANGLLSRSSAVILISRGVAKLPGDLHTGFAHRLLSRGSAVMHRFLR